MSPTTETSGIERNSTVPPADSIEALCAAHGSVDSGGRFQAGMVFGDWRLTAFIGRGGSGEVYCAEHVRHGTSAAVKVLVRDDERAKARFRRESKLLSELRSSSFPRFLSCGEANGREYLAMELLEPGELPAGDSKVARFILQVCDAVAELHARGIVHRDIKPGNILWRGGTPVLADLGLAKAADGTQATNHALAFFESRSSTVHGVGTPLYGAPEQMERGEASEASDIHSLGVLADKCFEGRPPSAWKRIIERATSSIPGRRYPSVSDFARAIRRRHLRRIVFCLLSAVLVPAIAAVSFFVWWRSGGDEASKWWSMCSRGEIDDVEECNEPIYPDRLYPAMVRYITNRVEGVVVRIPAGGCSFSRPIRLEPGEYLIVGPGVLEADISGPSNVCVRLRNCTVRNTTKIPYPENGIRYELQGRQDEGVLLDFTCLASPHKGEIRISSHYDGIYNKTRFMGDEPQE